MTLDEIDKTGLIREAYAIDGISDPECRSIFVDWVLKLPAAIAPQEAIAELLARFDSGRDNHPMTLVLREGLRDVKQPRRRGGRGGRLGGV